MKPSVMATKKGKEPSGNLLAAFNKSKSDASMPDASSSGSQRRDASASPLKEKLDALKKLRASSNSTEDAAPQPGAPNPILDAIEAVSKKLDKMALKSDLEDFKIQIGQDTKVIVSEAVDPIKEEIHDLKSRVTVLEGAPPGLPSSSKHFAVMEKALSDLDPSHRRLSFIGLPESLSAEARIEKIESFLKDRFPTIRYAEVENKYSGPYHDRKLGKVAFVEFSTPNAAKRSLDKLVDANFQVNGTSISIKKARTKIQDKRNYSMRTACDMVKASPLTQEKSVTISWDDRQVLVDRVVAFKQGKDESGGTFMAPYADLNLP
jgi:hypothetical protein